MPAVRCQDVKMGLHVIQNIYQFCQCNIRNESVCRFCASPTNFEVVVVCRRQGRRLSTMQQRMATRGWSWTFCCVMMPRWRSVQLMVDHPVIEGLTLTVLTTWATRRSCWPSGETTSRYYTAYHRFCHFRRCKAI